MDQFIPSVTESDVERILNRDIPAGEREAIRKLVGQLQIQEKPRVVLACIKNAAANMQKLKNNLAEAVGYYREIIGEAEYPVYMKKAFHMDKLSESEKQAIIEKDKKQYLAWLERAA